MSRKARATWVRGAACGVALLVGALSAVAQAEEPKAPSADDKAVAQALFLEGRDLENIENWPKACDKFAESQRLDPQVGTQGKLANCYEKVGRTASAWALWGEVLALSERQTGEKAKLRADIARQRIAELEPKLSRLKIKVTERITGLEIKRGGVVVGSATWDMAVPVDPMKHDIVATAPGRATWKKSIEVPKDGASVELVVPKLAVAEAPPPPPPKGPPPTDGTPQLIAGGVVTGLGAVGLGLGVGFGVMAMGKNKESRDFCRADDPNKCSQQGVDLRKTALTDGNVSTAGFVVGGAALVAGLVTIFTAPSAPEPEGPAPLGMPTARLDVGPTGFAVTGTW